MQVIEWHPFVAPRRQAVGNSWGSADTLADGLRKTPSLQRVPDRRDQIGGPRRNRSVPPAMERLEGERGKDKERGKSPPLEAECVASRQRFVSL